MSNSRVKFHQAVKYDHLVFTRYKGECITEPCILEICLFNIILYHFTLSFKIVLVIFLLPVTIIYIDADHVNKNKK